MNFKQGFFRIWVVGSVLFIGAVAAISYDKVSGEFNKAAQDWSKDAILLVPVDCKEARGTARSTIRLQKAPGRPIHHVQTSAGTKLAL